MIILLFSFLGELLKYVRFRYRQVFMGWFSIYCTETRLLPHLQQSKMPESLMIEIMPLMFIPAGAGLIDAWMHYARSVQIVMIMVVSTIVVMIVSGHVTQFNDAQGKRKGEQQ